MTQTHREPTKPGEILRYYLTELGITQRAFAAHLGGSWTQSKINEIIRGKRGITPATALALADALGTTPDLWLNAQKTWDLWQARQTYRPIPRYRQAS